MIIAVTFFFSSQSPRGTVMYHFRAWSVVLNVFFLFNFKEIMDVEHLWFSSSTRPQEKDMELTMEETISPEENMVQTLTNMADKRLFKLVKWCKSLPLFKNILVSRTT
jgi:hypothetical protein